MRHRRFGIPAAVLLIHVALGGHSNAADTQRWRAFVSKKCGVSFVRPDGWTIEAGPDCSFVLRPADYAEKMIASENVDTFSIAVGTGVGSFEDAAEACDFYKPQPSDDLSRTEKEHIGEWLCSGQVPHVAQAAGHASYRGLACEFVGRCYHEGGGYVGQCDWFYGFVSSGGRWLSVNGFNSGLPQTILRRAKLEVAPRSAEIELLQTVSRNILSRAKEAPEGNYLLIDSRTTLFEFTKDDEARAAEAGIPLDLFRALANQAPHDLRFLPDTADLRQVASAELMQIFADGPRWDRFYARFPNSRGFVRFSGPVFSTDGTQAVLWVDYNCHGDCGWGSVVYFKRTKGSWVKAGEWLRYIS